MPLLWFAPALRPGYTLSPLDNLFTSAPWRAIAPGPVQPNQALGDVTQVFHPWALWAAREVRAGRPPLWNPYAYAGAPFCSNPQTACLFPLTWLGWALPPTLALTLPAIVKVIAAGLAMYWFLRGLALRPLAGFVRAPRNRPAAACADEQVVAVRFALQARPSFAGGGGSRPRTRDIATRRA